MWGAGVGVLMLGLTALAASLLPGCGDETGVCTACCSPRGLTYCKDGWTKAECTEWNRMMVNGLPWHFHGGQTCAGRGTPATP